jgi:hypothetical protein
MHEHPEITVLGAVCVITDASGDAVGQTRTGLGPNQELAIRRFTQLGPPPLGFPPCMVRMDAARGAHFNPAFRRSQDSDFLLRVMLGKTYGMSTTPLYAYSQAEAASLDKTLEGYRYRLRCYGQYTERYPVRSRAQMAKMIARMGMYKATGLLHAEQYLIARRWQKLSREAEDAFRDAKQTVTRAADSLRGVS